MVTSEELAQMQSAEPTDIGFKLAIVTALFTAGTAKIQFYGEETASEKEYSYLASYKPVINDIVLVAPLKDTYIILGSVLYNEANGGTETYVTPADLTTALANYAAKTHAHNALYYNSNTNNAYVLMNAYSGETSFTFRPSASGNTDLGTSSYKFNTVYASTGTINTSDEREKDFVSLVREDRRYIRFFWMLIPKAYKLKQGTSGRTHVGFYSQDIEIALEACGLTSLDFAGFIKSPLYQVDEGGNETEEILDYVYGLRYEEFIGISVAVMQDMNERLTVLEGRVLID